MQGENEELNKQNEELKSENKQLKKKYQELEKKYNKQKSNHNRLLLRITLLYAVTCGGISPFFVQGIKVFSQSFSVRLALYAVLVCIIIPSIGSLIGLFYRSYNDVDKNNFIALSHNEFTENASCRVWWQERCQYYKQPEILRNYAICWSVHVLSLAAFSIISCFAIKGINSVVRNNVPLPEWHSTIIAGCSLVIFILSVMSDGIFYYSLQAMVWWSIPPPEYKKVSNKEVGKVLTDTVVVQQSVSSSDIEIS